MEDDKTKLDNEEVVEDQPQPSPAPAEQQEEEPQDNPELQEEEEPEEPEPAPSRREQLRVQDLLRKYGPPKPQAPSQTGPDFRSHINADEEVYKELEDTTSQYIAQERQAVLKQAEYTSWRRFLQLDENQIRSKYDILDPSKPDAYHGTLEKALQQKYLRFVGFDAGDPEKGVSPTVQNPDISYAEFVEAEMEFSDELASQKVFKTTQNIARQAATTGLRPDGSTPKRMDLTKAPEDMSDEELQAAIKATMPRDARGRFTQR